jgi:hypothetical protein
VWNMSNVRGIHNTIRTAESVHLMEP